MDFKKDILVFDIETIKGFFLLSAYSLEEGIYYDFSINQYQNDLYSLISFLDRNREKYWVGYNNLNFDNQIVEFIWRKHEGWIDKTALEIAEIIWKKAQDIIDDSNYGLFPPYQEKDLTFKPIDLFKINHYDNKNRMVSLKRVEFELDLENIEEMSVKHDKIDFTLQEAQELINYCHNDVYATKEFYLVTIGEHDHPLYKGNNQLQLRLDIQQEFDVNCLNYSDSKIGDEIIKKFYCEEKGIEYKELPKKGFFRKEIALKNCVAKYVEFQSKELKEFLKKIKSTVLKSTDDFKEHITFYGNTYSFMKGGIHTENKPEIFEADENTLIVDYDVASFYPAIIINNEKYPYHLGKEFLKGYDKLFKKRLELKPLSKKDKRIKGIVDALKLSVNATYGKSSDMQSWMYDKQLTMFTTITGELSLLMLIEAYELNGIHVISSNTDGVTIQINKSLINKVEGINKWWMELTKYELERTDYSKMIFSTVNDYIAVKTNGELKFKGDFLIDTELHKNKSYRIIRLALKEYFLNNINPEEFVKNHKNIFDFCIRAKASKDFHYEGIKDGKTTIYNKLIRYFIANDGEKLLKIKNPECQTNAAELSEVNAGEWKSIVCNYLPKEKQEEYLKIVNHKFYLEKINEMIFKIEHNGKKPKKQKFVNENQLNLF